MNSIQERRMSSRSPKAVVRERASEQTPCAMSKLWQALRFSLVGGLNTLIDVLFLNCLLQFFPPTNTPTLLAYNALAFSLGAMNSFFLNKYWTFGQKQKTTGKEITRFMLVTLAGIGWSSCVLGFASTILRPLELNTLASANISKVIAIVSSALMSYVVMRLWVFVRIGHKGDRVPEISFERSDGP